MNIRLFSKKHNLYTDSPNWPSNQRTWSNWALSPSGEVLEMVCGDDSGFCSIEKHDKREFVIEPSTGYFDNAGKQIFVGDILRLECYNLDYEIVWCKVRFGMKALYEIANPIGDDPYHFREQADFSEGWRIVGNIHS